MRRQQNMAEPRFWYMPDGPHPEGGTGSTVSTPKISDALWQELVPLIEAHDPPARVGRHRADMRLVLEAILYRLALGCSWNRLPSSFPHTSSVYRAYRRWLEAGLLDQVVDRTLAFQAGRSEALELPSQPRTLSARSHTT
jgi:transposase